MARSREPDWREPVQAQNLQDEDGYATGDASGQEVSTVDEPSAGEVVRGGPAIQSLIAWCVAEVEGGDEDNFAALERIVREALTAESMADVLREKLPVSGKAFTGRPFTLYDFTLTESDFTDGDGCPFYANMDVGAGSPEERRVINCGGWTVMAQLKRWRELGAEPWVLMLKEKEKATKRGYHPLRLVNPV